MPLAATLAVTTASAAILSAGSALAEDRYGPPAPIEPAASIQQSMPIGGWLTWSRKSAERAQTPPSPQAVVAPPTSMAAPVSRRVVAVALPTSLYGAAAAPASRVAPWPANPPAPRQQPTAASSPTSSRGGLPPHFYSVQREFAATPETASLPRQFFADSAGEDLAAPPPPLPPHPVPGSQAATSPANTAANRARATDIATSDSASN